MQGVISIHTLRVEGDSDTVDAANAAAAFQSTPSAWRVTYCLVSHCQLIHISIHTLRVEGDRSSCPGRFPLHISIHTLRVEGDVYGNDGG